MTRSFYPGAWYVDALPSGEFCVLFPNARIETHRGAIPLPPGETFGPLFLRCTNVNGFRFAGQAHDTTTPAAWEWAGSWRALPPPCVGVSPLIYDRLGILHLSDGSIGSQGWRACADDGTPEGRLVTGDATYTRQVAPGVLIHEYTEIAGLLIGQGHDGGVVVWDGATLRLLEAGDGRFVRVNADGEAVAVSFMKAAGAVSILTSLRELRALPPVPSVGTTVPPPGTPPAPTPEPIPMPIPDYTALVQSLPLPLAELGRLNDVADQTRAAKGEDHPDTQAAERAVNHVKGACAQTIVLALNAHEGGSAWGLLHKAGGQHWTRSDGEDLSTDIAFNRQALRLVDVMADRGPSWDVHAPEDQQPLGAWRAAIGTADPVPVPDPPPVPPAPSPIPSEYLARLAAVEAALLELEAAGKQERIAIVKLSEAVDLLRTAPKPSYRVVGQTSRVFGHTHALDVRLEPV